MSEEELNIKGLPLRPVRPSPMAAPVISRRKTRSRRTVPTQTNESLAQEVGPSARISLRPPTPIPPASPPPQPSPSSTVTITPPHPHISHPHASFELRYIQDLIIYEVVQDLHAPRRIGVCPFIGSNLPSTDHMVPFALVFLPNSEYGLRLLYVIKETVHINDNLHFTLIAAFLMTSPGLSHPTIVGTHVPSSFVTTVQSNIRFERARAREAADQAHSLFGRPPGI